MTGPQKEVRRQYRTAEEIAAEQIEQSPIGQLIAEIRIYADGRKSDVARGAETPALAAVLVEKFGEGLAKAAHVFGSDNSDLTREVDRLVREIDPQYRKHRQYRFDARPAGLALNGEAV